MGKITQTKVRKRNVFCNKCQREYSSSVEKPICGHCRSSNVVEASSISNKMALKVTEREINARLDKLEEVMYDLNQAMVHIQKRLDKQWEHIYPIEKVLKMKGYLE